MTSFKQDWLSNWQKDLMAGTVVALALIPEAIAFSIIAGLDPKVGLYASFCIAVITAFAGGRPGMISAATGAMALLMIDLVKDHGLDYLLAATILTGILQLVAGYFNLGNSLRFVSKSVMTGFVNALAILIFLAQLAEFEGQGWEMYAMVVGGLGIIYLLPRLTRKVPSPLVCIVVLTVISELGGMHFLRTVGDMGELPSSLPAFLLPNVPLNFETLFIILPYSIPLVVVGLLESLMTASIVDGLTDTESDKNRECRGQGLANLITGFFGGMAGCAMIGQSVINIRSGGRGRLSTLWSGLFLLFLIVALGDWVARIPMAALVAVMIMVAIGTFSWASLKNLKTYPKFSSFVMIATVVTVVYTHNLAWGVMIGILLSALSFARKVDQLMTVSHNRESGTSERRYTVDGQLFFVSAHRFSLSFDFSEVLDKVVIDVSRSHFWDISAVAALDKVVMKFKREGTEVEIIGMNRASATIVGKLAVHDKEGADLQEGGH